MKRLLWLVLFSLLTPSMGIAQEVLFFDDFEDGIDPSWIQQNGGWVVEDGRLVNTTTCGFQACMPDIWAGDLSQGDYVISFDLTLLEPSPNPGGMALQIYAMFSDPCEPDQCPQGSPFGYRADFGNNSGGNISRYDGGGTENTVLTQIVGGAWWTPYVDYHVKFGRQDGQIVLSKWADGEPEPDLLISVPDNFYNSGYWGLSFWYGIAGIDNFKVEVFETEPYETTGFWRFEEGIAGQIAIADSSIIDWSGFGNNGTPNGSPVYSSDVPTNHIPLTGELNTLSMEFTSPDDEIVFNSMFPFHESGDATIEFYLKVNSWSTYGCPLWSRHGNDDRNRYNFQYNSDFSLALDYREPNGNLHPLINDVPMTTGEWHHLAYVRWGNSYSIFQDGVLAGSGNDPQTQALPDFLGWTISGRNNARLNGNIDEVRFTTRALTPDEFLISTRGAPSLVSIADTPEDQGGFIDIVWEASSYDDIGIEVPIASYDVQRLEMGIWTTLTAISATQAISYQVTVPTPDIFTLGQPEPFSSYRVVANSSDLTSFFYSTVDSAYSIDNLAPPVPDAALLQSNGFRLVICTDPGISDLGQMCVFRGSQEGFTPETPIYCSDDLIYQEYQMNNYYYRIQYTDIHGNISEMSPELGLDDLSPVGDLLPTVYSLEQNHPNPFNPATTIKFNLPESSQVTLRIYDISGKLVRELLSGEVMIPGRKDVVWNGRDDRDHPVSAGVYFYKLDAGDFSETRRMALVK